MCRSSTGFIGERETSGRGWVTYQRQVSQSPAGIDRREPMRGDGRDEAAGLRSYMYRYVLFPRKRRTVSLGNL